jgi:hypothetical protein
MLQNRSGSFGKIRGVQLVRLWRALSAHRFSQQRSDAMENLQTLKLEYEDCLRNQRGLSEKSIYDCWRFADRFLHFRFKGRRPDLSKITPADIARFMQHLVSRGKPFRDKTPPTHLRNFFRFLFKSGKTNVNLTPSVPRIAQKYASTLPRHLLPEQVETLIAATKADTAAGRRNYAMALLMARDLGYGRRKSSQSRLTTSTGGRASFSFAARDSCMIECDSGKKRSRTCRWASGAGDVARSTARAALVQPGELLARSYKSCSQPAGSSAA